MLSWSPCGKRGWRFLPTDNICYIKPCLVFDVLTGFVVDMRSYANIDKQQGKRGILWAWPGQLSHLPPPAVGIMALINHKRLGYSLTGLLHLPA